MALWFGIFLAFCALLVGGQQIAEKKCSEFREGTIQRTMVIPLTLYPRATAVERFDCSKTVDLIVNGEAANPGEFPHQALLGFKRVNDSKEIEFSCGGSLISEQFVLTAAHCFAKGNPVVVRLGATSLNDFTNSSDVKVKSVTRYEQFSGGSTYHDIALVELQNKVKFGKYIRPACLWTSPSINMTTVIATGFGFTEHAGTTSNTLQKVTLDFLDKSYCHAQFKHMKKKFSRGIIDEQLCIGSLTGGKDTCQGDSGGPVQTLLEEKGCIYHVIGITSTGAACGSGKSASIYTKVSAYIPWIENLVWGQQNK